MAKKNKQNEQEQNEVTSVEEVLNKIQNGEELNVQEEVSDETGKNDGVGNETEDDATDEQEQNEVTSVDMVSVAKELEDEKLDENVSEDESSDEVLGEDEEIGDEISDEDEESDDPAPRMTYQQMFGRSGWRDGFYN